MSDHRVLVADDNEDIRRDVVRVLGGGARRTSLAARAARLLPGLGLERLAPGDGAGRTTFSVETASSGEEALERARAAREAGAPIAVAFVDVRMPPGIDGSRVARVLREEDPDIEVVLITAYADRTIDELNAGERDCDRLLFLKKPYAREELYQLALSLSEKRIQRRSLRVARERLELIFRATSDGLVGLDADHRVIFANRAARELLRLGQGTVRDTLWGELAALGPRRLAGSSSIEVHAKDRWLELGAVTPTGPAGGDVQAVLAIRDVTARKEVERLKDEFIQNTSHELRTPLVAIRGYLDLAIDERLGALAPPLRKGLEVARRASGRLLDLIDALLELARLEALGPGAVGFEPVDLNEVVQRVSDVVRPSADAKKLALEVALDPACRSVMGDHRTLEVALRNLLGNAIKFTERGTVGIRTRQAERGRCHLEVWDTGPGLPNGIEPVKLFERFRQGDGSISRAKGGVGIGLSLVERILRLHGRDVLAQNQPSGGACFSFELEVAGAADAARRAVAPGATPRSAVLVIDRSRATRDFLRLVLGAAGHDVRAAATLEEASRLEMAARTMQGGPLSWAAALVDGEPTALAVRERFAPSRIVVLTRAGQAVAPSFETLSKPVTLERAARLVTPPAAVGGRDLAA